MGRHGITAEDVHQAILQLQSEPRSISVDNIREVLGTGSKSTIARFLREWKASKGVPTRDPLAVPDELAVVVNGLWNQVQDTAARDIAAYQAVAQHEIQSAQQQYHEEQQHRQAFESRCQQLDTTLVQQQQDYQQLQHTYQQEQLEKQKLIERVDALIQQKSQQDTEQQRLHALLKHMQHNLEHYQQAIQRQREEQTVLLDKQRYEGKHQLRQLQQQWFETTQQQAHFAARCESLQQHNTTLEQQLSEHRQQAQQVLQRYQQLQIADQILQSTHDQLRQQHDAQVVLHQQHTQRLTDLETQLMLTTQQLEHIQETAAHWEKQSQHYREENITLIRQKALLEGQLQQMNKALSGAEI